MSFVLNTSLLICVKVNPRVSIRSWVKVGSANPICVCEKISSTASLHACGRAGSNGSVCVRVRITECAWGKLRHNQSRYDEMRRKLPQRRHI